MLPSWVRKTVVKAPSSIQRMSKLFGAMILKEDVVYGGVAADIRVLEGVAGKPAREQAGDSTLDAVMFIPVNELITKPEQRAVTGAPCITGAVEEDDVLSSPRFLDGLAVKLGPFLGVAVMVALRVCAGEQDSVVGETLTEVRHPSRGAVADEFLLDNVLDPISRLRVRQVHEGRREFSGLDPVRFALPILY
jgi:hypothetical protein